MPVSPRCRRKRRWQCPNRICAKAACKCATSRTSPAGIGVRRFYLIGGTFATTAVAVWVMLSVLWPDGISVLEGCLLGLFILLFAWIAMSFASAVAGFVTVVARAGRKLGIDPEEPLPTLRSRTALLMPTYNEDPRRLLAGLQAIYESVAETGQLEHFDFFVLSDTTREHIGRAEELVYGELCDPRRWSRSHLLPPPRRQRRAQGRQRGRLGASLRWQLLADADSGRRQRHDRRHHRAAGRRHGK